MKHRGHQIKNGQSAAIFVYSYALKFVKKSDILVNNSKTVRKWHHNVLRMNRKPPIGSLGGSTILTPGAPDPPKRGKKTK